LGALKIDGCERQGKTIGSNIRNFLALTEKYTSQNTEPGDYYKAVWCRDAAYILKDQYLSGHRLAVLDHLKYIWKNQIGHNCDKLIYGRGSPETDFTPLSASNRQAKNFIGALPTTIYDNFSEIYALNPDIDSTALMIYVSSWILTRMINESVDLNGKSVVLSDAIAFLVPLLFQGIEFLLSQDEDGDGLLEQDYNEDWMDTVLREGKIVYSQGCWLLALGSFAKLLCVLNNDKEALRIQSIASKLVEAIETKLWSQKNACYLDIKSEKTSNDTSSNILYQDTIFYILAITEQLPSRFTKSSNSFHLGECCPEHEKKVVPHHNRAEAIHKRMLLTLGSLRTKIWQDGVPLVTEKPLQKTGPWVLQPNEYHNHTYWPWITAMELLTRFRCGQIHECNTLLSNLLLSNGKVKPDHDKIFHEWIDPKTLTGGGAYPFRTGISAFRLASFEIMSKHS